MKVENLSRYGKPLGLPGEAQKRQVGIVLSAMREQYGLLGMVPFLILVLAEQLRIRRAHPKLGRLGCDHDLAGYPVNLNRVESEFRRPCTLAAGDDDCDFNFYRKGTAPRTEHLNK